MLHYSPEADEEKDAEMFKRIKVSIDTAEGKELVGVPEGFPSVAGIRAIRFKFTSDLKRAGSRVRVQIFDRAMNYPIPPK
jgi:hypothetical protein